MRTHPKCSADIFARVQSCCPQSALRKKTVVVIGCGGSRQFVEELARCGVGRFVLIDGDTVALSNLSTQQAYLCEVGHSKVEVLRDRLLDISPEAEVIAVPRFLDDSFRDELFERVVGPVLQERPTDVLICGCADSFPAQARAAALAMQYEDRWFIEIDLNTEALPVLLDKCIRYYQYLATNIEQRRNGGVFPIPVWIVPEEDRKQKLIAALDESFPNAPNMFAVITAEEFGGLIQTGADGIELH